MGKVQIKSGGTFLRLFSEKIIKDVMCFNHEKGFMPLVYIYGLLGKMEHSTIHILYAKLLVWRCILNMSIFSLIIIWRMCILTDKTTAESSEKLLEPANCPSPISTDVVLASMLQNHDSFFKIYLFL